MRGRLKSTKSLIRCVEYTPRIRASWLRGCASSSPSPFGRLAVPLAAEGFEDVDNLIAVGILAEARRVWITFEAKTVKSFAGAHRSAEGEAAGLGRVFEEFRGHPRREIRRSFHKVIHFRLRLPIKNQVVAALSG